jgi:small GTP-binding protein
LLRAEERRLVDEQKELIREAERLLTELDMLPEDLRALEGIRQALDELFLLVVVGEYNAGKSTLINCLLGEEVLEAGDLPTTREVHLLRFGQVRSSHQVEPGLLQHQLPAELLRDLSIVDTPGTNSMQRREQELTERFVPRADLVLFLTSLVRPYAASESDFLRLIRSWGKKILFVVNHTDVARGADQIERVREYVREQARRELQEDPPIFAVSAREALERGDGAEGAAATSATNEYPALEAHLKSTLGNRERVRLKLLSPLRTMRTVLARQEEALAERLLLVQGDRVAMDGILTDVDRYETRMRAELSRYQAQIENVLLQMERRGHRFLDELVRIGNILRLRDTDVVENRFRNEVVADTAARIEEEVGALIDWLVRENLAAWDRANGALEERRAALHESAGKTRFVSRAYVYNREEIFRNLAGPVRRHLDAFEPRAEADRIVTAVNHAIARTLGVEALVVGVGAILTAAFTTLSLDVTGTIGGTILVFAGLFLLPHRRARLKRELTAKLETLRLELAESIEKCFGEEVRRYAEQLRSVFTPERDAARARVAGLEEAGERLGALERRRAGLEERVSSTWDPGE